MYKNIASMLQVVEGEIQDESKIKEREIDTIVNAANPTLMGSKNGVDCAIHTAVDKGLKKSGGFKKKICRELKTGNNRNLIRCERGRAVVTGGYKLCRRIIHVVGISCDGERKSGIDCSSSRIDILESCYYEIVQIAKEHLDIKNIAIPIIGAGEYGFPFETAVKIAIASVGNALAEWKNADNELFEMAGLSHIYFYIFDTDKKRCRQNLKCASEVLDRYRQIFKNDKKAVFQNSFEAHVRYLCEIKRYDNKRGYFAAAKGCRMFLMLLRFLFMPIMFIKDWRGGDDWERRRQSVERLALGKMVFPVAAWGLWLYVCDRGHLPFLKWFLPVWVIYNISDTVTYLLTLILMSDIQRPSANIIRSMIMLLVNYMEVSLGMAFLYFVRYKDVIGQARKAVRFGILGEWVKDVEISGLVDYVFVYADAAVKFFFISIVFGYFSSHMKQRRFRS